MVTLNIPLSESFWIVKEAQFKLEKAQGHIGNLVKGPYYCRTF